MTTPFKQALTLLRDLADMQNGEKKDNCTCCPECGCKEYVNKNLVGDGYRMCRECHQDWWTDIKYSSKFCKPLIDRVYDFLNEHEAPIELPTEDEIKHQWIKACPQGYDMKKWLEFHEFKDGVINISEPFPCKGNPMDFNRYINPYTGEESTRPPKGMHPKTWAFLNEGKN